ncbi:MAG: flavodoxin [Bacilli bacterium]
MKTLMIYFSYSNNTKNLVQKIEDELDYDVVRIERKTAYSSNYDICAYQEAKEEWEKKIYPSIKEINKDVNDYDRLLVFFPIWWYTYPMAIGTFFAKIKDYKGEVIVFENSYTNDPHYVTNSLNDIKKVAPSCQVKQGLFNRSIEEHIAFIKGDN